MEKMLYGSQSWSKVERQFWMLSIAGYVVWILYVLIFEIVLFSPKQYEDYEPNFTVQQYDNFDDFMSNSGGMPAGTIAELQARQSRNVERNARNIDVEDYNRSFVWRGLSRALGYPVAWLGALLTFITIYERLQQKAGFGNGDRH